MTADLASITSLPLETKRSLLAALVRDLMTDPHGQLAVSDEKGELLLLTVPADPRGAAEKALRNADPEYLAELRRRSASLEDSLSLEEIIEPRSSQVGPDQ